MSEGTGSEPGRGRLFCTTHWTVVLEAGQEHTDEAQDALATLCETYWYPLYAFARGLGRGPEEAEDLVQGFFVHLIERNTLRVADRERGRFRTFLLTAFKRFTTNDWVRERAQKRGGGERPLSLDYSVGERRLEDEIQGQSGPDQEYERRWALTLIENARARLRQEFIDGGKAERFDTLEPHLVGDPDTRTYAELAQRFGISEAGVKTEAFRLRQRYRHHLRAEVAKTVASQKEVDDEIAHLMTALGSG